MEGPAAKSWVCADALDQAKRADPIAANAYKCMVRPPAHPLIRGDDGEINDGYSMDAEASASRARTRCVKGVQIRAPIGLPFDRG
jgi:hypothetical protein